MRKPIIFTLSATLLLTLATSTIGSKDVMCSNAQKNLVNNQLQLVGENINIELLDNTIVEEEVVSIDTYSVLSKKSKSNKKKSKKEDTPETIYEVYGKEEVKILQRIVEAECTGQEIECKINVANVILNRVESDSFPNTIEEVVFQKHQFSPISDGRYYEVEVTKDTIKACEKAFIEKDTTDGSTFFCNPRDVKNLQTQKWFKKLIYVMKDNSGHCFYKQ